MKGVDVISGQEMLFYPAISCIISDNKEAHALAHIKSGTTIRPCRFCLVERTEIHKFRDATSYELRSGAELLKLLHSDLNDSETKEGTQMQWLNDRSVQTDILKLSSTVYLMYITLIVSTLLFVPHRTRSVVEYWTKIYMNKITPSKLSKISRNFILPFQLTCYILC